MSDKRRIERFVEIIVGFLLTLSVLSMLFAYLFDFDYTIPNATFSEDMDFMRDNIFRQRLSAYSWLISGGIHIFLMPFYLIYFQQFQKGLHLLNAFVIVSLAFFMFRQGITVMEIANMTAEIMESAQNTPEETNLHVLQSVHAVWNQLKIILTLFGLFLTILTVARFREVKFPVIGSTLAFLAGPVVITFTWLNPDHFIMTTALATGWTGLLIIGTRLVTFGLKKIATS